MLHPSLCICGRNLFVRTCGGIAYWSRKCHENSIGCPRYPMALSNRTLRTIEDACVCKARTGSWSRSHVCKTGFYGGKRKHRFLHLNWDHVIMDSLEAASYMAAPFLFPL